MQQFHPHTLLYSAFIVLLALGTGCKRTPKVAAGVESAPEAVARVRALQFQRDFGGGFLAGKSLVDRFPEALELRAWYIVNLSRSDRAEEAVAEAEKMMKAHPDSPWSAFALAGALNWHDERGDEALAAIKKALAKKPHHPDFLWLKAEVLVSQGRHREAIAFVDSIRASVDSPAELVALKGYALYALARNEADTGATFAQALAAYEAARRIDSSCVNAYYLPGYQLLFKRRISEAYPLMKKAAGLSSSTRIHNRYWRAIMGLTEKPPEAKQAEVAADIEALLEQRPQSIEALFMASQQYGKLDLTEKQRTLEEQILQRAPANEWAEWVLVNRYRRFADEHRDSLRTDPALQAQYRRMLRDFIDYPHHPWEDGVLLGDAYRSLFHLAEIDSSIRGERLLEIVNGLVEHEDINPHVTYGASARLLAERTRYYDRAEEIARQGIEEARKKIDEQNEHGAYDTEQEYQRALGWYTGIMYDALGWVYFQEGRLDSAETALLHAYALSDRNETNLYHLGRLYEAREAPGRAETFYVKGLAVQTMGTNPNDQALKTLYQTRHGSLEDYEGYLATLKTAVRKKRKQKVLDTRLETPRPFAPFELTRLDGGTFSSKALQGKIAAINFWGTWCGPCVEEMPDLQKLYEKYRDDPEVVILTVNNDPNPDDVRAWMQEQGYDFPVLLDDGYLSANDVHVFPTTWFIGEQGRIAFSKEGFTDKLVEEFSWRVEALEGEQH